ncbi:hypothetical protein DPMN_150244 [Dreissena polymorpha]|uniref:Uncharacterized protein n=1 Tax=Dreissena polymorpha TaxID=45954 RepID=A0A9D4FDD7_DREPO|nr:hypothetical protein DPMN_150244 [Dreissena polymorpha]
MKGCRARSQSCRRYDSFGMSDRRRRPLHADDIEFWELENDVRHGFNFSRTTRVERGLSDGRRCVIDVLNRGYIDADKSKSRQHDNALFYVNIDAFTSKDSK